MDNAWHVLQESIEPLRHVLPPFAFCTIMYCAFALEKMDNVSMHSNGGNRKKVLLYARHVESIVQGDYIPIDGYNRNLSNAFFDVRSIIGISNCANLMISIFKCERNFCKKLCGLKHRYQNTKHP